MTYAVTAFYKFVQIEETEKLVEELRAEGEKCQILGTILVAREGINSTIASSEENLDAFMNWLRRKRLFKDIEEKRSTASNRPFYRFKVRLKKEIVTIGEQVDPTKEVGTYVEPEEWDQLINSSNTLLIDTRNRYETEVGTFKNAIDPKTDSFREFPDWVRKNLDPKDNKKVAMFCTGGIRCEKATSLLKQMGFEDVYHLKGGILKYLENIPDSESSWDGSCFLFDNRVGVESGLAESDLSLCSGCREPLTLEDRKHPDYEEGVCCAKCAGTLTEKKKESLRERHRQILLAQERGEVHMGKTINLPTSEASSE